MKKYKKIIILFAVLFVLLSVVGCGTKTINIVDATIQLTMPQTDLTLEVITPTVRIERNNVILTKDEDYTADYLVNLQTSTLTVIIQSIGSKYEGSLQTSFLLSDIPIKTYYLTSENTDYYTVKDLIYNKHSLKVLTDEAYELSNLLSTVKKSDEIIIERDLVKDNLAEDLAGYVISVPISIKGATKESGKYKVEGIFRIDLTEMTETEPVKIENLEISHTGKRGDGTAQQDERRGILIKNGAVQLKNNYIHLSDETTTTLATAPTGIQISVSASNTVQDQLTYLIEGNRIGKYHFGQTTASSSPSGILVDYDTDQNVNITFDDVYGIYEANIFDDETEAYINAFDYRILKYTAGVFKDSATVLTYIGNDLEYLADGLEIKTIENSTRVYIAEETI